MTPAEYDAIWRRYHEISRLNRFQRDELDQLRELLYDAVPHDTDQRQTT